MIRTFPILVLLACKGDDASNDDSVAETGAPEDVWTLFQLVTESVPMSDGAMGPYYFRVPENAHFEWVGVCESSSGSPADACYFDNPGGPTVYSGWYESTNYEGEIFLWATGNWSEGSGATSYYLDVGIQSTEEPVELSELPEDFLDGA